MSKKPPRLPRTPRRCSSPAPMEKTGSGSSRSSDSPIHWETLMGTDSQKTTKIKPSSWDNSDDELPLTLEKDTPRGHIYSSESLSNRKSVAAEINELKKQFFQAVVTETVTDIEELRERLETSLRNDRRQSPARVRRRTKSSSSSSTVMDALGQNSPNKEDEFNPQYEAIFDDTENTAPVLELDSRFYLDNFFAELRRKRISILESTVGIAYERDEDFQEVAPEDPNEFVNLSDSGYYNRSSRKLSQILEVEENKKDSDKDAEECSENTDFFLKFSRKPEDSDCTPLHTARSKKDEKLFENLKEKEYELKFSSVELQNFKKAKHKRDATAIASELKDEVISLTAKTGTIQLNTPRQKKEVKKNNNNLHQIHDDDVNWSLIENLKLDLMKTPENSTPRKSSRREKNSGSGSNRSTRDGCLQSPKFSINLGKESARSLKVENIKTPNSIGKSSVARSDRSVKDYKSSSGSVVQEKGNILLDLESPSLASHTSNQSLELQHILLEQGVNTNGYSQRSDFANEASDQAETSNGPEMPYRSNHSECSSRSVNSRSSRSSRSYRLSSNAIESRMPSQRSEKLENLEPLERAGSRRSSSVSSRTELGFPRQTNTVRSDKSRVYSSRNREPTKSTPQGTQAATPRTNKSYNGDVRTESKGPSKTFDNNEGIPGLVTSEWIDVEKVHAISSNRSEKFLQSQPSSRSEIIISESLDKEIHNEFMQELPQSRNSWRKSVTTENSDILDGISSSRSTKDKSRLNSCRSEERTLLNIPLNTERSDEINITGRTTDRSGIVEECEDTPTQTLQNDSESDRRLSVINELSFEDVELSNTDENPMRSKQSPAAGSKGTESGKTPKNHPPSQRSVQDELITKPESEGLWNDLIETFNADQDQPFNWHDNFLGFLNTNQNCSIDLGKEPLSPVVENAKFFEFESGGKEEDDDLILSKRLRENVCRSPPKSEKILSAKKRSEKREDFLKNLDLDTENNLTKKIKSDNDAENLYYFEVEKTGNFGIGEFGDVTCWNLGVPHTLEEGKPKGDGDGILSKYHKETPILKQDSREKNSKIQKQLWMNLKDTGNFHSKVQKSFQTNDDLSLMPFFRNDLKPSKSDNCIKTIEFSQCAVVDSSTEKNKSKSEQKPLIFDTSAKRKKRAASSTSSIQYSSSECLSDETGNQELDFESVRRTASLTDLAAKLRRSGYVKLESNENLYNSRSRLFEKVRKDMQDKDATNLNIFLARKKEEDKTEAKSNWLILKQSRGKACHKENKKFKSRLKIDKSLIKKDSKEYLYFKSGPSIPTLKLRESNCFQNFYKRVISVFCLTSNSSLPTSK